MMHEGLRRLYSGDFNQMITTVHADGTRVIELSSVGEGNVYKFRVKDLYGEHEEVLEHEVIENKVPPHVLERMEEAKRRRQ